MKKTSEMTMRRFQRLLKAEINEVREDEAVAAGSGEYSDAQDLKMIATGLEYALDLASGKTELE
jgi:hypothetical protein